MRFDKIPFYIFFYDPSLVFSLMSKTYSHLLPYLFYSHTPRY